MNGGTLTAACVASLGVTNLVIDSTTKTVVTGSLTVPPVGTLSVQTAMDADDLIVRGKLSVAGGTLSVASLTLETGALFDFTLGDAVAPISVRSSGNVTASGTLSVLVPSAFVFDVDTRIKVFDGLGRLNGAFSSIVLGTPTTARALSTRSAWSHAAIAESSFSSNDLPLPSHSSHSSRSSHSSHASHSSHSSHSSHPPHSTDACFTAADADNSGVIEPHEFQTWMASPAFAKCMASSSSSTYSPNPHTPHTSLTDRSHAPSRRLLAGTATNAQLDCPSDETACYIVGTTVTTFTCPPCPTTKDNAGLAAGATIGAVIGVALIVILIILICTLCKKQRKSKAARLAARDAAEAAAARQEAEALAKREAKAKSAVEENEKDIEAAAAAAPATTDPAKADAPAPVEVQDPVLVSSSGSSSSNSSSYDDSGSYFSYDY